MWVVITIILAIIVIGFFVKYYSNYFDLGWSGFKKTVLNFLKQLGLMLAFAFAIVVLVGIILIIQTIGGRWRAIRVFLSYHHEHENLVAILEKNIRDRWIKPDFVPFAPADHDILIERVQRALRLADVIIVLPGLDKSFVDAEILAASTLFKPIIFLKVSEEQKMPDTSYKGYPVFDLAGLEARQFHPLKRFILYVCRSSKDILNNFTRTLHSFLNTDNDTLFYILLGCGFINTIVGPFINVFVSLKWEQKLTTITHWIFTLIFVTWFAIKYFQVVINRLRAIRIARQKTKSGELTYLLLAEGLDALKADRQIMTCILTHSLPARYQVAELRT